MAKFYVESYGCAANLHDAEIMRGILGEEGHVEVQDPREADFLLINTCTVKTPTANRMVHRISVLSRAGKPLVVAGCFAKAQPETVARVSPKASMIGPNAVHRIGEVVREALAGRRAVVLEDGMVEKPVLPHVRTNPVVEVVEVASGCLSSCTFCQTKVARGTLFSYRPSVIREAVERAVRSGAKEVWLTSQDMSAYGRDIGTNLAELLEGVTSSVEGDYAIRVGMMNPLHFRRLELDDLVRAYGDAHVFKFLHLCVQSGSDDVLREMRRGYAVADFTHYVRTFRGAFPSLTLMTDVIVGYPTEDEEDFEATVRLMEEVRPDFVNISRFYPRPKTEAARLRPLPDAVVNRRSREITEVCSRISRERMEEMVGWEGPALVDEVGPKGEPIARNLDYRPIAIPDADGRTLLGEWIEVEVVGARTHCLVGRAKGPAESPVTRRR